MRPKIKRHDLKNSSNHGKQGAQIHAGLGKILQHRFRGDEPCLRGISVPLLRARNSENVELQPLNYPLACWE